MACYIIRLYTDNGRARFTARDARIFGERNEGARIEAETKEAAVLAFNSGFLPAQQYNPFYLKIEEL